MNKKNTIHLISVLTLIFFTFINCSKDGNSNPNTNAFLADSNNQNRVALLEDFTGVRCQYCPDGHVIAKDILDANPGKFLIIAVHGGTYGSPATGWPDFTTPYVTALTNQAKLTGYPAGTVSRIPASAMGVDPQTPNGYALDRDKWEAAANFVMAQKAPVNIGAKALYNANSRILTVKVDLYYTADQPGTHDINVALLQDKLYGLQITTTGTDSNYQQNHVLRDLITGQWGDNISDAGMTKGTKVSRTYTYTVPTYYNGSTSNGGGAVVIYNMQVVVFITNGHLNVLNAKSVVIQ